MARPSFRMWGSPYTGYATLAFLLTVLVLMAFNYPVGTITIGGLVVLIPALIGGWYLVRDRVAEVAAERVGDTDDR
jgi:L-asparagine permease